MNIAPKQFIVYWMSEFSGKRPGYTTPVFKPNAISFDTVDRATAFRQKRLNFRKRTVCIEGDSCATLAKCATPTFKLMQKMNESLFAMLIATFKTWRKQRHVRYTHWDIKALAREIAPEKWAAFDSSPAKDGNGIDKYYAQREFGLGASMSIAAKLLDAGWVNRERPMLWNDNQLDAFVTSSKYHKVPN